VTQKWYNLTKSNKY